MHTIRDSVDTDLAAITAIYAHYVLHTTSTFEITPPTEDEMRARRADVLSKGLPYIVVEVEGAVVGYAYCQWFKPRPAYRFSAELSIYLSPSVLRRGLGRALMQTLLDRGQAVGLRKLLAVIGDSANEASVGLHSAMGFTHAGLLKSCGWKFDRWIDVIIMERPLGEGDSSAPTD